MIPILGHRHLGVSQVHHQVADLLEQAVTDENGS
jgi:hypothetical protein